MSGEDEPMADTVNPPADCGAIVREEGRHVINEQLQTLRDTDQKAQATARIVAIVLGLVVSGISIADEPSNFTGPFMMSGAGLWVGSLLIAVLTYSADRPSYGVGPGYFDTPLAKLETKDELENDLMARYADWIDENGTEIRTNGLYLFASQLLFIFGTLFFGWGIYQVV